MAFLKLPKIQIQAKVKEEEISITLERPDPTGYGGTSSRGNVAKLMFSDSNSTLLTDGNDNTELRSNIGPIMVVILTILTPVRR